MLRVLSVWGRGLEIYQSLGGCKSKIKKLFVALSVFGLHAVMCHPIKNIRGYLLSVRNGGGDIAHFL